MAQYSKGFNSTLQIIPQIVDEYSTLSDAQKEFISSYINGFEISADTTEDDILQMKQNILDLTEFVANNKELDNVITLGTSLKLGQDSNGNVLSVSDYNKKVRELFAGISSFDDDVQVKIRMAFGIEENSNILNSDIQRAIEHVRNLLQDEFDSEADGLSVSEVLSIYYNITAEPNSLTFDELKELAKTAGVDWDTTVDVWDFSELSEGLDSVEEKFGGIISAMDTLKNGTKLTVGELAKLALQYPELLKASNLFADTSIENQRAMLDAVLNSYELEHDALVDTKIAELTATNQLMQEQISLENSKKNKIVEIADLQANGKLDSEEEYQQYLKELHDLEGRNYVTFSDGVLSVNQDMLQEELKQIGDKVEKSKPLFGAQGDLIVEANYKGVSEALKAFPQYASKLSSWAGTSLSKILSNIATNIKKALSGDTSFVGVLDGVGKIGSISGNKIVLETKVEGGYTIDGKTIDEWSAEYQEVINRRVKTITEQIEANNITIDNLEKLKGLNLTQLYGSEKSGGSGNAVEEYIADIDDYREAYEKLTRIQTHKEELELQLSNTKDLKEKIRLQEALLAIYAEEQEALHNLNNLRDSTIIDGADKLRRLGFDVEYDADKNWFFVENIERLNELAATSRGEYGTLQEATNALREDTESLINTLESLNKENQDGSESWWALHYAMQDINDRSEYYDDAADSLDTILDLTIDLIKHEKEQQVEVLEGQIDKYREIVNLKKESLQTTKDENDYNKEVATRIEEIAKLQTRIDKLSLDKSREAQAKKYTLEEELAEKQVELSDYQSDYALEKQQSRLDAEAEAFDKSKSDEIKEIKDTISSTEKLYQLAIARIDTDWDGLYKDLLDWNYEYGNTLESELVTAWNTASVAVQEYGSYLEAVAAIDVAQATDQGGISSAGSTLGYDAKSSQARNLVSQMRDNSISWFTADNTERVSLEDANRKLGERIGSLMGKKVYLDDNGEWWIGNERLYEKYHSGGVAGGLPTLKQNEVMAILEKGEPILDKEKEDGLYKIIDFATVLSERLGKAIDTDGFGSMIGVGRRLLPSIDSLPELGSSTNNVISFNPVISVTIEHSGNMTDSDAARFGRIAADNTLMRLSDAFNKKGIGRIGNSALKQ